MLLEDDEEYDSAGWAGGVGDGAGSGCVGAEGRCEFSRRDALHFSFGDARSRFEVQSDARVCGGVFEIDFADGVEALLMDVLLERSRG